MIESTLTGGAHSKERDSNLLQGLDIDETSGVPFGEQVCVISASVLSCSLSVFLLSCVDAISVPALRVHP